MSVCEIVLPYTRPYPKIVEEIVEKIVEIFSDPKINATEDAPSKIFLNYMKVSLKI